MTLPGDMLATADRRLDEEAWRPIEFPNVLSRATSHDLACVGGQFQFRVPSLGVAEMYWINAESTPRQAGEDWCAYVQRANAEVLCGFTQLMERTDFHAEAQGWKSIKEAIEMGTLSDPTAHLYFVAYFNSNPDTAESSAH